MNMHASETWGPDWARAQSGTGLLSNNLDPHSSVRLADLLQGQGISELACQPAGDAQQHNTSQGRHKNDSFKLLWLEQAAGVMHPLVLCGMSGSQPC